MRRVTLAMVGLVLALAIGLTPARADTLDLRAFDGRASTLLARLKEAGFRVYRLVDVADLRVPADLRHGAEPKAALDALAKASSLQVEWIDGKPLLVRPRRPADNPTIKTARDIESAGWLADRGTLAEILRVGAASDDKAVQRVAAEAVLRFGRAAGAALLDRGSAEKLVRLMLADDDWLLRRGGVIAAADLQLPDAADIVAKAAGDKHLQVRLGAALAAGRLGGDKGAAILDTLVERPADKAALGDYQATCYIATYACIDLGGPRAAAILGKILTANDGYLAAWAARAAGYVGGPESLTLLTRATTHPDSRVWRGAAIGLGRLRQQGAIPLLKELATRPVAGMLRSDNAAAISLGLLGGPDAAAALNDVLKVKPDLAEARYGLELAEHGRLSEPADKPDTSPLKVDDLGVTVRADRPRVFLRRDNRDGWTGPSVEKLRANWRRADYQRPERKDKLPRTHIGQTLLWLITGDELAGLDATSLAADMVAGGMTRARGSTPSYAGISIQRVAAIYDWLHDHGDLDPVSRRLIRDHLQACADEFYNGWLRKNSSTVFYSRRWGCLGSVGVTSLALFGESPAARDMLGYTIRQFRGPNGLGSIRQAEDGGAGGATYSLHHAFTDNANLVAAIGSATDFNAAESIAKTQGDWLRKQMYFQMYFTYPDGTFFRDADVWAGATDRDQYRMQIDTVTGLYRDGIGRTYADRMEKRYPAYFPSDYHTEFVWQFFVFNEPAVTPELMSKLPRAAVFGKDIEGYVFWRSSWDDDATIVSIHAGDQLDMHCGADAGKFVLFKGKTLAGKNGAYVGYGSALHSYYCSARSANVVVFDNGKNGGGQTCYRDRAGGVGNYAEFQKARAPLGPPTGKILLHEADDKQARLVIDLGGSTPDKGTANKWIRELVFLDYTYLLVLDRVTPAAGTRCSWLLNADVEPAIDGSAIRIETSAGRLIGQMLLPEKPALKKLGGKGAPVVMRDQWTVEVTGSDPAAAGQVFLAVLLPIEAKADAGKGPDCSVQNKDGELTVKVGPRSYTFKK